MMEPRKYFHPVTSIKPLVSGDRAENVTNRRTPLLRKVDIFKQHAYNLKHKSSIKRRRFSVNDFDLNKQFAQLRKRLNVN